MTLITPGKVGTPPMNDCILREAIGLVEGPRNAEYGKAQVEFTSIADIFEVLTGSPITAEDVCLIMIIMKLVRNQHKSKRDNLVDAAGYLKILSELGKGLEGEPEEGTEDVETS